jgi:Domain of unknown function (DUF4160)
MPTLAVVHGIRICMYYADHAPAHFHAIAGEHEIIVDLASLSVIDGAAPNRIHPAGTKLGRKTSD